MIKGILTQDEYSQLVKTQEDVEKVAVAINKSIHFKRVAYNVSWHMK